MCFYGWVILNAIEKMNSLYIRGGLDVIVTTWACKMSSHLQSANIQMMFGTTIRSAIAVIWRRLSSLERDVTFLLVYCSCEHARCAATTSLYTPVNAYCSVLSSVMMYYSVSWNSVHTCLMLRKNECCSLNFRLLKEKPKKLPPKPTNWSHFITPDSLYFPKYSMILLPSYVMLIKQIYLPSPLQM